MGPAVQRNGLHIRCDESKKRGMVVYLCTEYAYDTAIGNDFLKKTLCICVI